MTILAAQMQSPPHDLSEQNTQLEESDDITITGESQLSNGRDVSQLSSSNEQPIIAAQNGYGDDDEDDNDVEILGESTAPVTKKRRVESPQSSLPSSESYYASKINSATIDALFNKSGPKHPVKAELGPPTYGFTGDSRPESPPQAPTLPNGGAQSRIKTEGQGSLFHGRQNKMTGSLFNKKLVVDFTKDDEGDGIETSYESLYPRFATFDQKCEPGKVPDNVKQMIQVMTSNRSRYQQEEIELAVKVFKKAESSCSETIVIDGEIARRQNTISKMSRSADAYDPSSPAARTIKTLRQECEMLNKKLEAYSGHSRSLYVNVRMIVVDRVGTRRAFDFYNANEQRLNDQLRTAREDLELATLANTQYRPTLFQHTSAGAIPRLPPSRGLGSDPVVDESIQALLKGDMEVNYEDRVETPEEMKSQLLEHQKIGLNWLLNQEKNEKVSGGILADDMGLGKTVQTISLILANKPTTNEIKTTLIVAPVALLNQWANEISRHVKPEHRLKVYIHHKSTNPKILTEWEKLQEYDIVITTYDYISNDCSTHGGIPKKGTTGTDTPNRLHESVLFKGQWFRVVLDEAQQIKNRNTVRSIAVCQLNAKYRWCLSGTPMQNSVVEYYSFMKFLQFHPYDEYGVFMSRIGNGLAPGRSSSGALKKLQALISNTLLRRTKKTQIDGRPILQLPEKHIENVESAFDVDQAAYYKDLENRAQVTVNAYLNLSKGERRGDKSFSCVLAWLTRLRQACCHPVLIEKSIKDNSLLSDGSDKNAVKCAEELSDTVIQRILTQIKNDEFADDMVDDQARGVFECPICMESVLTQDIALMAECGHPLCKRCASDYAVNRANEGLAFNCVTCQHEPKTEKFFDLYLFKLMYVEGMSSKQIEDLRKSEARERDNSVKRRRKLIQERRQKRESEAIDRELFAGWSGDDETDDEQLNKKRENGDLAQGEDAEEEEDEFGDKNDRENVKIVQQLAMDDWFPPPKGWISSSKIEKCFELVNNIMQNCPGEKVIVFSQFTAVLDLMTVPLFKAGYDHLRYDGGMTSNDRSETVKQFMDGDDQRILLVSLKAGNVGLTLTAANHVVVMDPFWNPYVEDQAVDRAHRIGQRRDVHVYKLHISNTIEDRILDLQEKKREVIDAALDEGELRKASQLGDSEIRTLFNL